MLLPSFRLPTRGVRFGVVTDSHYARKQVAMNRFYCDSTAKMRQAVEAFNQADLDFIIELGDLKDMGLPTIMTAEGEVKRKQEDLESEAIALLREIEGEFQRIKGPCYHVLGNHDMDCISKEQSLANTRNAGNARGRNYYSFVKKGVKFIVLDGNFNPDMTPYEKGNFEWWKAYVPQSQIDWLDQELAQSAVPVVVFIHQMLDKFSDIRPTLCIGNAEEVVSVLERHGNVLAVIQGHHHAGHYSWRNNIHYWTLNGMIESAFPAHNSYAIVEINAHGDITIEGFVDTIDRYLPKKK